MTFFTVFGFCYLATGYALKLTTKMFVYNMNRVMCDDCGLGGDGDVLWYVNCDTVVNYHMAWK